MRWRTGLSLVAVLLLCTASDAVAQRGGRGIGRGFGVSPMGLLRVEKVQQEINLRDEQQEQLQAARQEVREALAEQRGDRNFQDLSREERRELFTRIRQERTKAEKEKLAEVLNDQQMARLNEIYLQVAGPQALDDPQVVAALNITDEQKKKIAAAEDEARDKQREAFGEVRDLFQAGDQEAAQKKMAELREQRHAMVLAVLSDEQKQQFEQMKGEAIELSPEELRLASGFGGRRRGGR